VHNQYLKAMYQNLEVDVLIGKTLAKVENKDNEQLLFTTTEGDTFMMFHQQDCCECVMIDDIEGNLADLMGSPVLVAEEITNSEDTFGRDLYESWTWTFYKFATAKGYITIKWLGQSNGYYSESVDFEKV
jgi:hypothetical protein